MKENRPLLLIDGSSYLYRAYHAMPALTNSGGEPTGAIYGFVGMTRRLMQDYTPQFVAIVFDAKGKTFRDELYADYKANRSPMPDDLRSQIEPIYEFVAAMGFPQLIISGVEADDVIGTLATQATRLGLQTVISTGDKDFAQLVNEQVTLINTMTDTVMDAATVHEKFGVRPDQIIDYLALMGDAVDNIPGVPKVGPKTAVKWLNQYGSLQGVIAHASEIKGKVGENLRACLATLPISYELATIKCDVPLLQKPDELHHQGIDHQALQALLARFEFKTWLKEQLEATSSKSTDEANEPNNHSPTDKHYDIVLTETDFDRWLEKLSTAEIFAFDTETTHVDYTVAELVGVSFSIETGTAAYVPCAHDYAGAPMQLSRERVLKKLKPLLENPDAIKVGQNLKYDMNVLSRYGINMQGVRFDTMLESYVLNSVGSRHDTDTLALKYLQYKTISFEAVAGTGSKQKTFDQIDIEQAGPYAAEAADITLQLHQTLWPMLQQTPPLVELFNTIEMPLVPVLSKMECNGVLVDADLLNAHSSELASRLAQLQEQAYELAGESFNLSSPKQIQQILYDKLQLPILKKTPKGQPSTAESVLQELALDYPLPALLMQHRSLSKLKSTYTDRLPEQISVATGRVHTSYHQAVAATGRLSSSDPNLQNIPVRTAEGRRIRRAFIVSPGYQLVSADYSQIELRIMAHLSNDARLMAAFQNAQDVHRATAAELLGVEAADVTDDQRRHAKAVNFGLIYGMSAFGLARQLGMKRNKAQDYINLYFERYPGVKQYMETIRETAAQQGYVETLFGRRLYLPDIQASNAQRRQYAERTAINAPMQGSAADIIKMAMIAIQQWIDQSSFDIRVIMQVHDELVFEVSKDQLAAVMPIIQETMQGAVTLNVPLIVDIGVGNNWDEAH